MIDRIRDLHNTINTMKCYTCGVTKSIKSFGKREIDRKARVCLECFIILDN